MATSVLIINQKLIFAVTIKQALEQTGLFVVHPFTAADAALEFLRDHPQDVALVDFDLPGRAGAKIVAQLRNIQPDLAVIVSPRQPDADALMSGLRLQGMIDMPFTARDVIPLIQRATEAPPEVSSPHDEPENLPQTRQLGDEPENLPQTRQLGDEPENRPQTRPLSDEPENRPQTRMLGEETREPVGRDPWQTRVLDESPTYPPAQTRDLSDDSPVGSPWQTRELDEPPAYPPPDTRKLGEQPPAGEPDRSRDLRRRPPGADAPRLDDVLRSFQFDPPPEEDDTPAVSTKDSGALRQFLATSGDTEGAGMFDDVLEFIDPDSMESPRAPQGQFEGLVRSLSSDQPHTPLPDRQQQMMDFIVTTGMDSVLREIQRSKIDLSNEPPMAPETDTLPRTSFEKLAGEEPPFPTLEESGTVSDLLLGISDRGFRNVLSLLRGEEVEEGESSQQGTASSRPLLTEQYPEFFAPSTGRQVIGEEQEDPAQLRSPARSAPKPPASPPVPLFDFDSLSTSEADEETVAQVVLRAALDESAFPEGFSFNQLITGIEERLADHKLDLRPLPSWDMDTGQFRPPLVPPPSPEDSGVQEPTFLPEMLPPGELIPSELPELPALDAADVDSGRTTLGSASSREALQPLDDDAETMPDVVPPEFTRSSESVTLLLETLGAPQQEDDLPVPDETWGSTPEPDWQDAVVEDTRDSLPVIPDEEAPTGVFERFETEPSPAVELPFFEDMLAESAEYVEEYEQEQPLEETLESYPEPDLQDSWEQPAAESDLQDAWEASPAEPEPAITMEDAYIAQLALNLTQASLESSAEGTILTRDNDVIALSGHLAQSDALELRDSISNDWGAEEVGARFRFVVLPSSGKEYMLYSIRAEDNLTLSMIFAGTTPLRVIRQQGQRIINALRSMPELAESPPDTVPLEPVPTPPVEPLPDLGPLNAYAYVWLVRDPHMDLSEAVAGAISAGLNMQLNEQRWQIQSLQVADDHVYLLAGVPGETPAHLIMRELKRRSADIAHAADPDLAPQMLWADSYLILAPGRDLSPEEIQDFINFQRM